MVLGFTIMPWELIAAGLTIASLIVFQMLVGYRKIHFKGRLHLRIHKINAWTIITLVVIHATLAITYVEGWTIL